MRDFFSVTFNSALQFSSNFLGYVQVHLSNFLGSGQLHLYENAYNNNIVRLPQYDNEQKHIKMFKDVISKTQKSYDFINILFRANHTINKNHQNYLGSRKAISQVFKPKLFKDFLSNILKTSSFDDKAIEEITNSLENFFYEQFLGVPVTDRLMNKIKDIDKFFSNKAIFLPNFLISQKSEFREYQNDLDDILFDFFQNNMDVIQELVNDNKKNTILKTAIIDFLDGRSIELLDIQEIQHLSYDVNVRTAFVNLFPIFNLSDIIKCTINRLNDSFHLDIFNFHNYDEQTQAIIINNIIKESINDFTAFPAVLRKSNEEINLTDSKNDVYLTIPAKSIVIIPIIKKSQYYFSKDFKSPIEDKYLSFGLGKRACPAMNLVQSTILKQIVKAFFNKNSNLHTKVEDRNVEIEDKKADNYLSAVQNNVSSLQLIQLPKFNHVDNVKDIYNYEKFNNSSEELIVRNS